MGGGAQGVKYQPQECEALGSDSASSGSGACVCNPSDPRARWGWEAETGGARDSHGLWTLQKGDGFATVCVEQAS